MTSLKTLHLLLILSLFSTKGIFSQSKWITKQFQNRLAKKRLGLVWSEPLKRKVFINLKQKLTLENIKTLPIEIKNEILQFVMGPCGAFTPEKIKNKKNKEKKHELIATKYFIAKYLLHSNFYKTKSQEHTRLMNIIEVVSPIFSILLKSSLEKKIKNNYLNLLNKKPEDIINNTLSEVIREKKLCKTPIIDELKKNTKQGCNRIIQNKVNHFNKKAINGGNLRPSGIPKAKTVEQFFTYKLILTTMKKNWEKNKKFILKSHNENCNLFEKIPEKYHKLIKALDLWDPNSYKYWEYNLKILFPEDYEIFKKHEFASWLIPQKEKYLNLFKSGLHIFLPIIPYIIQKQLYDHNNSNSMLLFRTALNTFFDYFAHYLDYYPATQATQLYFRTTFAFIQKNNQKPFYYFFPNLVCYGLSEYLLTKNQEWLPIKRKSKPKKNININMYKNVRKYIEKHYQKNGFKEPRITPFILLAAIMYQGDL